MKKKKLNCYLFMEHRYIIYEVDCIIQICMLSFVFKPIQSIYKYIDNTTKFQHKCKTFRSVCGPSRK